MCTGDTVEYLIYSTLYYTYSTILLYGTYMRISKVFFTVVIFSGYLPHEGKKNTYLSDHNSTCNAILYKKL